MNNIKWYGWTPAARECYERGCICDGCLMSWTLGKRCRMKEAVLYLVREFGAPKEESIYSGREKQIINAILNGADTYEELEQATGLKHTLVRATLTRLYRYADGAGVVYQNNRYKLPDFVEWVRENEGKRCEY